MARKNQITFKHLPKQKSYISQILHTGPFLLSFFIFYHFKQSKRSIVEMMTDTMDNCSSWRRKVARSVSLVQGIKCQHLHLNRTIFFSLNSTCLLCDPSGLTWRSVNVHLPIKKTHRMSRLHGHISTTRTTSERLFWIINSISTTLMFLTTNGCFDFWVCSCFHTRERKNKKKKIICFLKSCSKQTSQFL